MELFGAKLQYEAGIKYYKGSGQGYTRNRSKAFKLFKEAAEAGLVEAMLQLSKMYALGEGCIKDYNEGLKWLERAANKGNVEAQYQLGREYLNARKSTLGCEWLEKAAKLGHVQAMFDLGECYLNSLSYYDQAIYWLSQPVLSNHPDALYWLAEAYERKEIDEIKMFDDEFYDYIDDEYILDLDVCQKKYENKVKEYKPSSKINKIYKKALQLYEQEVSFGDWESVLKVADMYLHGQGSEIDYTKAFNNLYHLANQPKGDVRGKNKHYRERALIKLAKMYELGLGCDQNIDKCNEILDELSIDKEWFSKLIL